MLGEESGRWLMGTGLSLGERECSGSDYSDGQLNILKTTELHTLKMWLLCYVSYTSLNLAVSEGRSRSEGIGDLSPDVTSSDSCPHWVLAWATSPEMPDAAAPFSPAAALSD